VYVCSCRAVNDTTVRAVIAAGAATIEDIGARCGAGTDCGGCHETLERLLAEAAVALASATHHAA
jgi:bacterioferritin-associated ferredoxin